MKKRIIISTVIVILTIGGLILFINKKSNIKTYKGNDITIAIKENTLTRNGATIIITDKSKKKNIYGEEFYLERKIFNTWFKLNSKEVWWELIGYSVDENNTLEIETNWSYIYGKLSRGTYRLLKKASNYDSYISVEFKIK